MTIFLKRLLRVAAMSLAAAPLGAHHSFAAEFDAAKPVTIEGEISKIRIVNPHSWIYLDVKNRDNSVTNWGFEFGTPILLHTKGIAKEDVLPGKHVRIEGFRSRNGGAFGYTRTVTLSDGRAVLVGSAVDAPGAARGR